MADQIDGRIGQHIGNYRLERLLGEGGFAVVYLGQHLYLDTQAAIKLLRTHLAQNEQEGFLHEARVIAHLIHPNIVRVLDFGMQETLPFLVMDYAPNGSLRDNHPRGSRLPLATICSYLSQVASALQYAHDEKLIHRDVKPENMLVGRRGEILLSDFGISVVEQTSQAQNTQDIVGSAPYMAPEQLQGKARPASDQYALAIVAYEWLCGQRPFQGSFNEVYSQQLFSPPPSLRTKNPAISPAIEAVVFTALAKDPHKRFPSVRAFADAFERASGIQSSTTSMVEPDATTAAIRTPHSKTTDVASQPTTTPMEERQQHLSRRTVLLTGLVGLIGIGSGATWLALSRTPHTQPSPTISPTPTLQPARGTLLNTYEKHSDTVRAVAWYTTRIASASNDRTVQIWDAANGGHIVVYREHSDSVTAVSWSPNGQRIASASNDNTVHVWNPVTAATAFLYTGHQSVFLGSSGVYAVAWSHNGRYLASGGADGTVRVWDATNGSTLYTYQGHIGQLGNANPVNAVAWSPDDTRIASGSDDHTVQVWDAQTGGNAFTYNKHNDNVFAVIWSPDGQRIASASADTTVQVWDALVGGHPFTYQGHTGPVRGLSWSLDGRHLASASDDTTVQVWNPADGSMRYTYTRHSKPVHTVAWSSDNRRIASGGEDATIQVWEAI